MVSKSLCNLLHFALPHLPWSNGAVEKLGREILRIACALLSELQLRGDAWTDLLPMFQSVHKNTPSRHLANTAPLTAFTGLPSKPPISTFMSSEETRPVSIPEMTRESSINIEELQDVVDDLHPKVNIALQ